MIPSLEYHHPSSLKETCHLLARWGEKAKVIAGGTDLLLSMMRREVRPMHLVDITSVPELKGIREEDGWIRIGAAVTHSELEASPLIRERAHPLAEAASLIGSPQIRNLGTIGGNVVNASPAADTIPPLMILEARATMVSLKGERVQPLEELIVAPYRTNLKPHEILMDISFRPLPEGAKAVFFRVARRKALAISRMSICALLILDEGDGRAEEVRISVGSMTPRPVRLRRVEGLLCGSVVTLGLIQEASSAAVDEVLGISGIRPSSSYKGPVLEGLLRRCLEGLIGVSI